MTAKKEAEELILKFMRLQEPNYNWFHSKLAKQCALILVDEIIKSNPHITPIIYGVPAHSTMEYWQEVRQEIENL